MTFIQAFWYIVACIGIALIINNFLEGGKDK
jgi:hypothetical protein